MDWIAPRFEDGWRALGFLGLAALVGALGCAGKQAPKQGTSPTVVGGDSTPDLPREALVAGAENQDSLKGAQAGEGATAASSSGGLRGPDGSVAAGAAPPSSKAKGLLDEGIRMANNNPQAALKRFELAASASSGFSAAHYNAGVMYERMGRYREAGQRYQAAIDANPKYFAAIQNLANLAVRQGDTAKAEALLLEHIRLQPGELGLRNRLSSVWLAANKIDAAEQEAKKILKADERNTGALLNLAVVFFRRGQHELATSVLDRAREINPNEAEVWSNLGFVYLAQDKKSEAVEAFKRATELRDDLPEAHNNLGALFIETHDYEAAIKSLQRAIALYPDFANAYVNLGNAYKGNRQYKESEDAYKKAASLAPEEAVVLYNLGVLHLDNRLPGVGPLERWDRAKEYLEKYATDASGLATEERKRVEGFVKEAERGRKREKRKMEADERRKLRAAKKKAKEEAKRQEAEKKAQEEAQQPEDQQPEAEQTQEAAPENPPAPDGSDGGGDSAGSSEGGSPDAKAPEGALKE